MDSSENFQMGVYKKFLTEEVTAMTSRFNKQEQRDSALDRQKRRVAPAM